MAFWVSNTPGQLPKWIFWYFVLLTLVSIASAPLVGSPGALAGAPIFLAVMAWKHQIKAICVSHLLGGVLAIIMYLASLGVLSPWMLNGYVPNSFILLAIYGFTVSGFVYQYRARSAVPKDLQTEYQQSVTPLTEQVDAESYKLALEEYEANAKDDALWAKHLIEAEGKADSAKWSYLKARAIEINKVKHMAFTQEANQFMAKPSKSKHNKYTGLSFFIWLVGAPFTVLLLSQEGRNDVVVFTAFCISLMAFVFSLASVFGNKNGVSK